MDEHVGSSSNKSTGGPGKLAGLLPWIILCAFCVTGVGIIGRNPLQMGGDEGMEFSKMLLVARNPADLSKAWNDQPWLHSWVFGKLFHVVGFHPEIPRLFALCCTALYCARLRRLMPVGSGPWHHALGMVLFLAFPTIPYLVVSAMLELPATLLALVGASVLLSSSAKLRLFSLFLGGTLAGVAVQIKLTAMMVIAAATLAFALFHLETYVRTRTLEGWRNALRCYGIWMSGLAAAVLVILCFLPSFSTDLLWANHVKAGANIPQDKISLYAFRVPDLLQLATTCFGFVIGTVWLLRRFRGGPWLLPVCYGFVAITVHLWHRPFWDYYNVHLAAAFAPIAAWSIAELIRFSFRGVAPREKPAGFVDIRVVAVMAWTALLSLWLVTDGASARREFSGLLDIERTDDNNVVNLLRSVSPQVTWAFSRNNTLIARAELLIVPEMTVLPKKRFWAGYKEEDILVTVEKYKPEVLVLLKTIEEKDPRWQPLLQSSYQKVLETGDEQVYFSKGIESPALLSSKERLKGLGL